MNYYRRYLGDYARDTKHLSMLEHGAYTLLLDALYATERPLPGDRGLIFKICGASTKREKNAVESVLSQFFVLQPTGFSQKRYEEELSASTVRVNAARDNGAKGGRPYKTETQEEATGLAKKSSPSSILQPNTKEESKSKHAPSGATKTSFSKVFALSAQMRSFAIDRGVANPDAEFEAFADHHQAKGSKFHNWEAAWRTWCRNSEKFRGGRNGARQPRAESFDERRQRKSQDALGEISTRAHAVVSQVGRRLPEPRGD